MLANSILPGRLTTNERTNQPRGGRGSGDGAAWAIHLEILLKLSGVLQSFADVWLDRHSTIGWKTTTVNGCAVAGSWHEIAAAVRLAGVASSHAGTVRSAQNEGRPVWSSPRTSLSTWRHCDASALEMQAIAASVKARARNRRLMCVPVSQSGRNRASEQLVILYSVSRP